MDIHQLYLKKKDVDAFTSGACMINGFYSNLLCIDLPTPLVSTLQSKRLMLDFVERVVYCHWLVCSGIHKVSTVD